MTSRSPGLGVKIVFLLAVNGIDAFVEMSVPMYVVERCSLQAGEKVGRVRRTSFQVLFLSVLGCIYVCRS
ncbi:hypothetical protein AVEN_139501-1, partial [Araneus ventricosus]